MQHWSIMMRLAITVSLRAIDDIFVTFVITGSVYQIGLFITKVRMIDSKKVPQARTDIEGACLWIVLSYE